MIGILLWIGLIAVVVGILTLGTRRIPKETA